MNKTYILLFLLLTSCSTPSILVTREQQRGDHYFNQHQYSQAIEHYTNSLKAGEDLGIYRNLRMEAEVCRKIAHGYSMQGKYSDAEEYLYRAIRMDSADNHHIGMIESYKDLGRISLVRGKYHDGIEKLEFSLQLAGRNEESFKNIRIQSSGNIYLSLSQAYLALGRFSEAQRNADKAHSLFAQAGFQYGLAESYLLKAIIKTDQGYMQEAMEAIVNSEMLAKSLGLATARQELVKSEISSAMGEYSDALTHNETAMRESTKTGIIPQIIWASIRTGDLFKLLGDYRSAESYYRKAEELAAETSESSALHASLSLRSDSIEGAADYFASEGSAIGSGLVFMKIADTELLRNNKETAMEYFHKADSCFGISLNKEGKASARLGKAKSLTAMQNFDSALHYAEEALSLSGSAENLWQIWYRKGIIMEHLAKPDSAKKAYLEAIKIIEAARGNISIEGLKGLYINSKIEVYDRLIKLLIEEGNVRESFHYSERARARAFLDLLGNNKIDFNFPSERDLIDKEQELSLRLAYLHKQLYNVASSETEFSRMIEIERSLKEELSVIQDEYLLTVNRIKLNSPEYSELITINPPEIEQLQAVIPSNSAVLQYWMSEDNIYLWVIRHNNLDLLKIATGAEQIHRLVTDARNAVRQMIPSRSYPLLMHLFRELISPAEKYIRNIETLCIIPHGHLHLLPFHALADQQMKYLIEKYTVMYMPSSAVMVQMANRKIPEGDKFLGMALGNKMIGTFTDLPGTRYELDQISLKFDDTTLAYEEESTESFLRNHIENHQIIHLATHGVFNEVRPNYSFLLFTPDEHDDGQLTVNEIMGLTANASLVTLSACETGISEISKGDELVGLSRAFLTSGAHTVSVSLWSVADRPTAELMTNFYKHLQTSPVQEAMAKAQRETMIKYPEPFYWAPFVIIGGSLTEKM